MGNRGAHEKISVTFRELSSTAGNFRMTFKLLELHVGNTSRN